MGGRRCRSYRQRRGRLRLEFGSGLSAFLQCFDDCRSIGRGAVKLNGEILVASSDVNLADARGAFEGSAHGRDTSASNILAKFELGSGDRCVIAGIGWECGATAVGGCRCSATVVGGFCRATNQEEGASARSDESNHDDFRRVKGAA